MGSRFPSAIERELAPFIAKYGLTKRHEEGLVPDLIKWVIYANEAFLVSLRFCWDPREAALDIWFMPASDFKKLVGHRNSKKPVHARADYLFDLLRDRNIPLEVPVRGNNALGRRPGIEYILSNLNEAMLALGDEYFSKYRAA